MEEMSLPERPRRTGRLPLVVGTTGAYRGGGDLAWPVAPAKLGSFYRIGLIRHQRGFVAGDLDADLGGRICLVTGANAGLGRATALARSTHYLPGTREDPATRSRFLSLCAAVTGAPLD